MEDALFYQRGATISPMQVIILHTRDDPHY